MKVVTSQQMNMIDRFTIEMLGIPGIVLMEGAALKTVEQICIMLNNDASKYKTVNKYKTARSNTVIIAGKGNNGGDALAVAKHLYNKGFSITVFIIAKRDEIKGDAAINLNILEKIGVECRMIYNKDQSYENQGAKKQLEILKEELKHAVLVIDGIFGTGIKAEITGLYADVINMVNESGENVVSIDIPSGVNGENGKVMGTCIKACRTVTFGLPKIGLVIHPGCEYTGEVIIADIGFPQKAIEQLEIKTHIIDENMVKEIIPLRKSDSNKGDYGRVLILSGSNGMTGSGCLTANAALRSGAGLVYLGVPKSLAFSYEINSVESITIPLEDSELGNLSGKSIDQIAEQMKDKNVIAMGMGLSDKEEIFDVVKYIVGTSEIPLVLDADALNSISGDVSVLGSLKVDAVITPHPGEMARLAGITIEDVQNNRIEVARDFAQKWKITTVLKGSKTIVAAPDGGIFINTSGNPGMATAGSGDVLTGIIAALIGQGIKVRDAAIAGVYIHGLAGDLAAFRKGEYSLLASDIINYLPEAFLWKT